MIFLAPLGFLALIGLIVLIVIYLIKPNYQTKVISSTYVWKLSLKYRKKRIPINKLRNILLFICQVLVITACAFILTMPFITMNKAESTDDKVVILDASASMMTETGGVTRFERAVGEIKKYAEGVFNDGGRVSLILAGGKADYVIRGADSEKRAEFTAELDKLLDVANPACTYGVADIDGAITLSSELTETVPGTKVILYTDTEYAYKGEVEVHKIIDPSEWNAAVLDVRAILEENYYRFEVDAASFGGVNCEVEVFLEISGINGTSDPLSLKGVARCENGEVTTVIFSSDETVTDEPTAPVFSYESAFCYIRTDTQDSFDRDNSFYLYGGVKMPLRVQYASAVPNNYFATALMVIKDQLKYRWNLEFVQVPKDETPAEEGFDIYIYEHMTPTTLPKDGVVILANPDVAPYNSGFRLGTVTPPTKEIELSTDLSHPVLENILAENITLTRYTKITSYDGFTPILYCGGDPVMMVKNESGVKMAVMSFSLNYSNLPVIKEFPLMIYNLIEYFTPSTFTDYVFEVNDTLTLNARTEELNISNPGGTETLTTLPYEYQLLLPGVYSIVQSDMSGSEISESFFVRVPNSESNISAVVDTLNQPRYDDNGDDYMKDIVFYIALALVILLFAEWWLHKREQL